MNSVVSLCNAALLSIGADTITSLTEDSDEAAFCNARYEQVRDAVLRAHPWNCAVRRAGLSRDASAPAFGYAYRYLLPTQPYCLRVLKVFGEETHGWRLTAGRYLETDHPTAQIEYIARVSEVSGYDPLLAEAIAARLAAEAAFKLVQSNSQREAQWSLYLNKLAEARSIDAREGNDFRPSDEAWLTVRNN